MGFFDKLFGRRQRPGLKAVPGALSYAKRDGVVVYNLLTPHMQQFMGRCVGAIKKAGIAAKGTGQFSILVGEHHAELNLGRFYQPEDDQKLIEAVLQTARKLNEKS